MLDRRIAVIAEKPDAARKIAAALAGSNGFEKANSEMIDVPDAFDGKHYLVFSALGHLYHLSDPQTNRRIFPLYDIAWFPPGESQEYRFSTGKSKFDILIRKRLQNISRLTQSIQSYINACDYDVEGETIGFNILEYACQGKGKTALRAKFSTLTQIEIRQAFSSLIPAGFSLAKAGRLRHYADYLWGINLSRALTSLANDARKSESFLNLSIGRVQGPTLAFIVDREIEKMVYVPIPRWDVECILKKGDTTFEVRYKNSPIKVESRAHEIFESAQKSKFAEVLSATKSVLRFPPRYPFNLGDLQREAYRLFRLPPSATLSIAEKLYLQALISYPRTESQRLPRRIGPEGILKKLVLNPPLGDLVQDLLRNPKRRSSPWQGPLDDPAHPAIFPTGESPHKQLAEEEKKIFELIIRRFCNTFAPDAVSERKRFTLEIGVREFEAKGEQIIDLGWTKYYPHFQTHVHPLDIQLAIGELVPVLKAEIEKKYDGAPNRYSDGSLLSRMESEKIGTKATRAETISTLVKRLYVRKVKNELVPSATGLAVVELLREHSPEILSTETTRKLETELESLQSGDVCDEEIAGQLLASLSGSLKKLRKVTSIVGFRAASEPESLKRRAVFLGLCPKCKTGKLVMIRSRRTGKRFVGCTNFTNGCNNSSPAPPKGRITSTGRLCATCGWPRLIFSFSVSGKGTESCGNFFCISRTNRN